MIAVDVPLASFTLSPRTDGALTLTITKLPLGALTRKFVRMKIIAAMNAKGFDAQDDGQGDITIRLKGVRFQ